MMEAACKNLDGGYANMSLYGIHFRLIWHHCLHSRPVYWFRLLAGIYAVAAPPLFRADRYRHTEDVL